ncbi:FAD-dependent oxidoreductase [Chloroflexota bacterium]
MRLLEPITIGKTEFRNRITFPPLASNYTSPSGFVNEREKNFWAERAKDVGFITMGAVYIRNDGRLFTISTAISDDKYIPGLKEITDAIHDEGAKAGVQLYHGGRECQPKMTGERHVAFYDYGSRLSPEEPRILTVEDIKQLEEDFAKAARRSLEAGFDVIEFHATHGVGLFEQSLSPAMNKRTDEYGGDFEGRVRFSVETVQRVKKEVGDDAVLIFRMPGVEDFPAGRFEGSGYSHQEAKQIAQRIEKAGADVISVSIGPPGFYFVPTSYLERGSMVHLAEGIKQVVSVPVITAGRIDNLELANRIVEEERADLVGICRPLVADPDLIRKTLEGRTEDIVPCMACNECIEAVGTDIPMHCLVNPACGREGEARQITPTKKPKKIMIVGGGPGGMEAALIAKHRGHDVVLYEKSDMLGGQLHAASKGPGKQEFDNLIWYYRTQIKKLGIKVELGQEVTPALVEKLGPDAVIVAIGAIPEIPDIPGVQLGNVVIANDLLLGRADIAGRRVVVAGSGIIGIETADLLADRGKQITLLGRRPTIGWNIGAVTLRAALYKRLRGKGVTLLSSTHLEEITDKGVVIRRNDRKETIDADTVVLAFGSESCGDLAKQLEGKIAELYVIGDCVEPRTVREAVYEGWHIAATI